ncbi:MAG: hypothetical protein ACHQEB_07710, partial [Chitinophagales bacterium]
RIIFSLETKFLLLMTMIVFKMLTGCLINVILASIMKNFKGIFPSDLMVFKRISYKRLKKIEADHQKNLRMLATGSILSSKTDKKRNIRDAKIFFLNFSSCNKIIES